MAHAYYHAKSSARKFGGQWEDYMELHQFLDHTKAHIGDNRHRFLRRHLRLLTDVLNPFLVCVCNKQAPCVLYGLQGACLFVGGT